MAAAEKIAGRAIVASPAARTMEARFPSPDHLPRAGLAGRVSGRRPRDPRTVREPGLSAAGHARGARPAPRDRPDGPVRRRALRARDPARRSGGAGLAPLPLPRGAGQPTAGHAPAGPTRDIGSSRSASTRSPRGCRTSSGAACRTRSSSAWPPRASSDRPRVLAAQVGRMLDDPRARALVDNFGGQWLQIRNLQEPQPRPRAVPRLRRVAPRGDVPRDRALPGRGHPRGSEHPRPDRRRFYVPERTTGRAITG